MKKTKTTQKAFVISSGCPENRMDAASIQKTLNQNGWGQASSVEESDLIFFQSCALTEDTERDSLDMVTTLQERKSPDCELMVGGCLPKINRPALDEIYDGIVCCSDGLVSPTITCKALGEDQASDELVIEQANQPLKVIWRLPPLSSSRLTKIRSLLKRLQKGTELVRERSFSSFALPALEIHRHWKNENIASIDKEMYCIKISTGCLSQCSFCAVRLSRGKLTSKSMETIENEFKEGLAKGFKKFTLLGTDIGAYGKDQGNSLPKLLKRILEIPGDYSLFLRNVNPTYLIRHAEEFQEIWTSGRIAYLGSALESGSDRILGKMRRKYTAESYKSTLQDIKNKFPDIHINTQIIVGFPSETDEDFKLTAKALEELSFDSIEVYSYQPRPNTPAAELPEQVSEKIKRNRQVKLLGLLVFTDWKKSWKQSSFSKVFESVRLG